MSSVADLSILGQSPAITEDNAAVVYALQENRLTAINSSNLKQFVVYVDSQDGVPTGTVEDVALIDSNFTFSLKTPQEPRPGFEYKLVTSRMTVPYTWWQVDETNRYLDWFLVNSGTYGDTYIDGSITNPQYRIKLTPGTYASGTDLATECQNQINLALLAAGLYPSTTIYVSYDTTTKKMLLKISYGTKYLYLCFRKHDFPYIPTISTLSPTLLISQEQRKIGNVHLLFGASEYADLTVFGDNFGPGPYVSIISATKYTAQQIAGVTEPKPPFYNYNQENLTYPPHVVMIKPKQTIFAKLKSTSFFNNASTRLSSDSDNRIGTITVPSDATVGDLIYDDQDDVLHYDIVTRNLSSFELSLVDQYGDLVNLQGHHWSIALIFEEHEIPSIQATATRKRKLVEDFRGNANRLRSTPVTVNDNSTAVARQVLDTDRVMATLAGIQRRLQGVPVLMPQAPALPPGPTEAAQQEVDTTTSEQ